MPSLPDLPTELLIEIVKYYPQLLISVDASLQGVPSDQFSGNDTLRALSQTCRRLRDIFLPVLWERVNACFTVRNMPKKKVRRRAKMLERRMNGIQRTPYIVPYIRYLTVTLSECNMDNWQPISQFVRVLQLLPNLRSLTIIHNPTMTAVVVNAFEGKTFSSVIELAVPEDLASILPCFPNIQILTRQDAGWKGQLLWKAKGCGKIHTINNFLASEEAIEKLRECVPHVKRLSIWYPAPLDKLRLLEGMDALSDLQIRYFPPRYTWQVEPKLDDIIAAAKRILRTSKAKGRKELRIQHVHHNVYSRFDTSSHVIGEEQLFLIDVGQ